MAKENRLVAVRTLARNKSKRYLIAETFDVKTSASMTSIPLIISDVGYWIPFALVVSNSKMTSHHNCIDGIDRTHYRIILTAP
ncbi:hypothetical protein KC357_g207 [Hortaea werneckii]|nr:hypothetical protein KC357_g207 [Hortaea werneckii]